MRAQTPCCGQSSGMLQSRFYGKIFEVKLLPPLKAMGDYQLFAIIISRNFNDYMKCAL
jgi:hypothetical protein